MQLLTNCFYLIEKITQQEGKFERIDIHVDNKKALGAFRNHWVESWKKNGWKNSLGEEVAHKDTWVKLIGYMEDTAEKFTMDNDYCRSKDWVVYHAQLKLEKERRAKAMRPRGTEVRNV